MNSDELKLVSPRTVTFSESKHFFDKAEVDTTRFLSLTSIEAADFYSWKQDNQDIDFDPNAKFSHWLGSGFDCWRDVRDEETKHFVARSPVPTHKFSRLLSTNLWDDSKFPVEMIEKISTLRDEITSDLEACFKNEAYGFPSKFYQELFAAYEQGGWPCGWLGKYPDGKLIVFDPNPK